MKHTTRLALTTALAAALVAGCSSGGPNEVPRSWIADRYAGSGDDYIAAGSSPGAVANKIDDHRSAHDRTRSGDRVFLRYRDDIVAISPYRGAGSRIEIDDYRDGHRRWHSHVAHVWPAPGSSGNGFRGGGPGSGK
ncbi:DUF4247 domain-containing protein [Streptomyces sp. TRM 70351]|uniref:DUF4247 domain-containing protein n=1 Tax=Streptomyces sp. TRM 70351 TaxID=3116552 RepID=UPI002E7B02FC|nr:DUF4247 domain-containing protein [Streptomyces sp. TRM 70351]MEE1930755.1 DUF4247 domain-containing protein [Streptomyces sp. TRM 70351]